MRVMAARTSKGCATQPQPRPRQEDQCKEVGRTVAQTTARHLGRGLVVNEHFAGLREIKIECDCERTLGRSANSGSSIVLDDLSMMRSFGLKPLEVERVA